MVKGRLGGRGGGFNDTLPSCGRKGEGVLPAVGQPRWEAVDGKFTFSFRRRKASGHGEKQGQEWMSHLLGDVLVVVLVNNTQQLLPACLPPSSWQLRLRRQCQLSLGTEG